MTRQGEPVPGGAYDYVINDNMIAGFAMVAWPDDYGESGSETDRVGMRILTYNPDDSWKPAED